MVNGKWQLEKRNQAQPQVSLFSERDPSNYCFIVLGRNPICLTLAGGGVISWRIASKIARMFSSWVVTRRSSSVSLAASSVRVPTTDRSLTKARMTSTLTWIARLLRNTLESIATPCSVKAVTLLENLSFEDVTVCDIPVISALVSSNMKSPGNLAWLRITA